MDTPKVPIAELRDREYWTPEQTAKVLGRGKVFWCQLFDAGTIRGHRFGGKRTDDKPNGVNRYIEAASARAYLNALTAARPQPVLTGKQRYYEALRNDPRITTLCGRRATATTAEG